jgi:hypothetical protein
MNKEQQELLDEAYEKYLEYTINGIETGLDKIKGYLDGCLVEYDGYYEHFTNPSFAYGYRTYNQEEFINECKTDIEFSEKWGLKINERGLTDKERIEYKKKRDGIARTFAPYTHQMLDGSNIPTRLIIVTYNDKTIESYE